MSKEAWLGSPDNNFLALQLLVCYFIKALNSSSVKISMPNSFALPSFEPGILRRRHSLLLLMPEVRGASEDSTIFFASSLVNDFISPVNRNVFPASPPLRSFSFFISMPALKIFPSPFGWASL